MTEHIRDKAPEEMVISKEDVGVVEELFSPIKDLIPEETCKLLNQMCRE